MGKHSYGRRTPHGFSLLEFILSLGLVMLLLTACLGQISLRWQAFKAQEIHQELVARLYQLRHQAIYQGASQALLTEDFVSLAGLVWVQKPLLGFASSGYPSLAGTISFQWGPRLHKITVPPASGAIRDVVERL